MVWKSPQKLLTGLALTAMLGVGAFALPAQAATLRMAWSQDATGLDPHKQTAFSSLRLLELVYEPWFASMRSTRSRPPSLRAGYCRPSC